MLDASLILEQDLMKKDIRFGGLDESGMEVDEEIVCKGEQVAVSSDETFSRQLTAEKTSAVNYSRIWKSLTVNCRGTFTSFICVFQPCNLCQQPFSWTW